MPGSKIHTSFWDALAMTQKWLEKSDFPPEPPQIAIAGRGIVPAREWSGEGAQAAWQSGWLDPIEVRVTWDYFQTFLPSGSLQSVWIPYGGEAYVRFTPPGRLEVVAPSHSLIWQTLVNRWDPAAWPALDELEWWQDGRPQLARRLPWGMWLQKSPRVGWQAWDLIAEPSGTATLGLLWRQLSRALGVRRQKLIWRTARIVPEERLGGIPVRLEGMRLRFASLDRVPRALAERPLRGVNLSAHWRFPRWNAAWRARMELSRCRSGAKLSAVFSPRGTIAGCDPVRERWLRSEWRQLPILGMSALPEIVEQPRLWEQAERLAGAYHDAESLAAYCRSRLWTKAAGSFAARRRAPSEWMVSRLLSRTGHWVLLHRRGRVAITLDWPQGAHPGHLSVDVAGVVSVGLDDLAGSRRVDRWSRNRHYWLGMMGALAETVSAWEAGASHTWRPAREVLADMR